MWSMFSGLDKYSVTLANRSKNREKEIYANSNYFFNNQYYFVGFKL